MNSLDFIFADAARKAAKATESGFKVGAYLKADNLCFSSGNVEHPNSALNTCAERMVLTMARGRGINPTELHLTSDSDEPIFPCGVCRQYMSIFPKLKVTVYSRDGSKSKVKTVSQLYPNPYIRKK